MAQLGNGQTGIFHSKVDNSDSTFLQGRKVTWTHPYVQSNDTKWILFTVIRMERNNFQRLGRDQVAIKITNAWNTQVLPGEMPLNFRLKWENCLRENRWRSCQGRKEASWWSKSSPSSLAVICTPSCPEVLSLTLRNRPPPLLTHLDPTPDPALLSQSFSRLLSEKPEGLGSRGLQACRIRRPIILLVQVHVLRGLSSCLPLMLLCLHVTSASNPKRHPGLWSPGWALGAGKG